MDSIGEQQRGGLGRGELVMRHDINCDGGKAVLLCCSCVSVVELCGVVAGHTCVIAEWGCCWLGGWCLQIPAPLQTHLPPPPPGWHLITSLVVPLHFVKCWKCMRISASQRHTRGERASERMKISRGHHFTLGLYTRDEQEFPFWSGASQK